MICLTSKVCRRCETEKPTADFSVHHRMRDGFLNECKACRCVYARGWRKATVEVRREKDRERYQEPTRRAYSHALSAQARKRSPQKTAARTAVNNAVRDGKMTPQPCEACGKRAEAHHPDYTQPLTVRWLCKEHHELEHHA